MATSTNGLVEHPTDAENAFAQSLLDLFSPAPGRGLRAVQTMPFDQRSLWAADALHRAINLAQMASSLGSSGLRHLHGRHADEQAARARALSRAYQELANAEDVDRVMPCGPILVAIATLLVELFGATRAISLDIATDPVRLRSDQRRALTLIASELIINALKYAFAAEAPGTIRVALLRRAETIELSVSDDGRGSPPSAAGAGAGTALMHKLAALLGADILHPAMRDGFAVVVSMPSTAD